MNTLENEILDSIEDIETITMESEMNVILTLSSLYSKQAMIMEYASSEDVAEEIIQEGAIWDQATGKGKKENLFIRILKFIPRLIKAVFMKIKSAFSKKSKDEEKVIKTVQKASAKIDLPNIVPETNGEPLTKEQKQEVVKKMREAALDMSTIDPKKKKEMMIGKEGMTSEELLDLLDDIHDYISLRTFKIKMGFDLDEWTKRIEMLNQFIDDCAKVFEEFNTPSFVQSMNHLFKHPFLDHYKNADPNETKLHYCTLDEYKVKMAKIRETLESIDMNKLGGMESKMYVFTKHMPDEVQNNPELFKKVNDFYKILQKIIRDIEESSNDISEYSRDVYTAIHSLFYIYIELGIVKNPDIRSIRDHKPIKQVLRKLNNGIVKHYS